MEQDTRDKIKLALCIIAGFSIWTIAYITIGYALDMTVWGAW